MQPLLRQRWVGRIGRTVEKSPQSKESHLCVGKVRRLALQVVDDLGLSQAGPGPKHRLRLTRGGDIAGRRVLNQLICAVDCLAIGRRSGRFS